MIHLILFVALIALMGFGQGIRYLLAWGAFMAVFLIPYDFLANGGTLKWMGADWNSPVDWWTVVEGGFIGYCIRPAYDAWKTRHAKAAGDL